MIYKATRYIQAIQIFWHGTRTVESRWRLIEVAAAQRNVVRATEMTQDIKVQAELSL